MKVQIITSSKGKPVIWVEGSTKNTPKQVAKAYKEVKEELEKENS